MDAELRQYLSEMEERTSTRFEKSERRMDAQFQQFEHRLEARFAQMQQSQDALEARLLRAMDQKLENMETKLLTAFHDWAQTYEVRAAAQPRLS